MNKRDQNIMETVHGNLKVRETLEQCDFTDLVIMCIFVKNKRHTPAERIKRLGFSGK